MKRNAIEKLIAWKDKKDRKPLWITGIKGVGKTYLALDFAKSFYEGNLYVNFETNAAVRDLFMRQAVSVDNDDNLIELLCKHFQIPTELVGNILIILDEIADCKVAMTALEELTKAGSNVPIIVISSESVLIDPELYESLVMYPMEFDEFLIAEGSEWYAEVIKGHYQTNRKVPEIVHNELLTLFEDYLIVGGMPAAVNEYISMESNQTVSEVHQSLYQNLLCRAMSQHNESEALKISQVMNIMPEQLMKENKKFQYRMIRKGATYAQYKDAITYLVDNHYLYKSSKSTYEKDGENGLKEETALVSGNMIASVSGNIASVSGNCVKDGNVIKHEKDSDSAFKLYLPDVGMLNSLLHRNEAFLGAGEDVIQKTVFENYMIQSLTARNHVPSFWESNSLAKIDYIIKTPEGIVPMEAKTSVNTRSKSMGIYKMTHNPPYTIRISGKNFEFTNHMKHIPYYAVFCLG